MLLYIGIDDTDNLESRGTGFRARMLAEKLASGGWGQITGITRHQLFVSPLIPYTSHNSSLCIGLDTAKPDIGGLEILCGMYLEEESAPGSDPGLCIIKEETCSDSVIEFGRKAKCRVIGKEEAVNMAQECSIRLSAHGGTGDGIIGALAAVGLRAFGQDGRFVWLQGTREMKGVYSAEEIFLKSGVKRIVDEDGGIVQLPDRIDVGDWFRPVLLDKLPTLLVKKAGGHESRWEIIEKERIKERY